MEVPWEELEYDSQTVVNETISKWHQFSKNSLTRVSREEKTETEGKGIFFKEIITGYTQVEHRQRNQCNKW